VKTFTVSVTTNQAKLHTMFTEVCPPVIAWGDKEIYELLQSELCFGEYPFKIFPVSAAGVFSTLASVLWFKSTAFVCVLRKEQLDQVCFICILEI
jgi:hypothetical protein